MEILYRKIKDFCQDQENEFSVLGYDASKHELGYISAIREIQEICEEFPDPTTQLKADKDELLEALEYTNRMLENSKDAMYDENYIESLIQKHKQ